MASKFISHYLFFFAFIFLVDFAFGDSSDICESYKRNNGLFANKFCTALNASANAYCNQSNQQQDGLVFCWIGEIIAKVEQCKDSFIASPGAEQSGRNFYENLLVQLEEQTMLADIVETLVMWKILAIVFMVLTALSFLAFIVLCCGIFFGFLRIK